MLFLPAIAAASAILSLSAFASPIAKRQQPAPTVVTLPLPVETAANFASAYLPYSGDAIQLGDEYTTVVGFASLVATETISGQAVTETMVLAQMDAYKSDEIIEIQAITAVGSGEGSIDINYCDIEGNVAICEVGHVYPGSDTTEISLGPTYSYTIAPSAVTLHPVKVASIVDTPEDLLSIYTQVGNQPLPTRL